MTTEISRRERKFERKKKAHYELIKENIPTMIKLKYEIEHINIEDFQNNFSKISHEDKANYLKNEKANFHLF